MFVLRIGVVALLLLPLLVSLPAASAACELAPCISGDWHGCRGPANPLNCEQACYTINYDPEFVPEFWQSTTTCAPMRQGLLGNNE